MATPTRSIVARAAVSLLAASALIALTAPAPAAATLPPPPRHHGGLGGIPIAAPIVGMAATPSGHGYWLVAADGGIFTFGDATFHGSTGALPLVRPIVGMAATPSGHGYWLVAADGGVFTFGDATFHGSTGAAPPPSGTVGIAATNQGDGYWTASASGEVSAFGDAAHHGDLRGLRLNAPVIDIVTSPIGSGYYLLAADGGVFAFGDATFFGSTGAWRLVHPVTAMIPFPFGHGYWVVASDGGMFTFGRGAGFFGSWAATPPSAPVVAAAPGANGRGYWLATSRGQVRAFAGEPMRPRGTYGLIPRRLPNRAAPLRVLGLGDSMMISLQGGFGAELAATGEAMVVPYGTWGYGFTIAWPPYPPCLVCNALPDYAPPWLSQVERVENFDAAVLMVGGWDLVARNVDGVRLDPFTRPWRRWYRRIHDTAVRRLTDNGAVVFWVSYPRCGTGPDLDRLDRISERTAARHDEVVWLDLHTRVCPGGIPRQVWFEGQRIDVLDETGHFTPTSARWVGRWITREMRSTFALARP